MDYPFFFSWDKGTVFFYFYFFAPCKAIKTSQSSMDGQLDAGMQWTAFNIPKVSCQTAVFLAQLMLGNKTGTRSIVKSARL